MILGAGDEPSLPQYCLSFGVAPIISLTVIKYDSPSSLPSRDPVSRSYHVSF